MSPFIVSKNMIDFIVPSLGRETLPNSTNSLLNQTNPNWRCYVGFDGLDESQISSDLLVEDSRIQYLYLKEKLGTSEFHGNAGRVRNRIMESIENPSEWTGFLDDDDALSQYYVEILNNELEKEVCDCYVFRMNHGGNIIPPFDMNVIQQNYVGISFCVRTEFLKSHNIGFVNNNAEDFLFLQEIHKNGGKIKILPVVGYFVRV
jgi:hypothetical protein